MTLILSTTLCESGGAQVTYTPTVSGYIYLKTIAKCTNKCGPRCSASVSINGVRVGSTSPDSEFIKLAASEEYTISINQACCDQVEVYFIEEAPQPVVPEPTECLCVSVQWRTVCSSIDGRPLREKTVTSDANGSVISVELFEFDQETLVVDGSTAVECEETPTIDYEHVKIPMFYCEAVEASVPSTHVRSPFTQSTGEDVRFLRHIFLEDALTVVDTGNFSASEIILWSGGSFSDEAATRQLMLDKIRPFYEGTVFYLNDIIVDFSQNDIRLTFVISGLDATKEYLINLQIQEGTQTDSPVSPVPVEVQLYNNCLEGFKILTSEDGDIANASQVLLDNEGNVLNLAGLNIYYDEASQTNVLSLDTEILNLANVNSLVVRPVAGNATVIINGGAAFIINEGDKYIFEDVDSASIDSQSQTNINYNQLTWS